MKSLFFTSLSAATEQKHPPPKSPDQPEVQQKPPTDLGKVGGFRRDQARGRYRRARPRRSHRRSRTRRSRLPGPPSTAPRTCAASARGGDRLQGRIEGNDVNGRGERGCSWTRCVLKAAASPSPPAMAGAGGGGAGGRCESMPEAEGFGGAKAMRVCELGHRCGVARPLRGL